MNHKYIMLTAMYHYELLQLNDNPTATQIRHILTTTNPHTMMFGAKRMMKKTLQENYGIRNRHEMQLEIDNYTETIWSDCAIYGLLIELYLLNPTRFLQTTPEDAQAFITTLLKADQNNALAQIWETLRPTSDLSGYIQTTTKKAAHFFEEENVSYAKSLYELFQQNKAWLPQTQGMSFAGFQLSRIISILADSHMCGYLSDDAARQALDDYGTVAQRLFPNWGAFLFSAVLGKQMMSAVSGPFIIDVADYVAHCCALAAHPSRLLELSGVWVGSDTSFFVDNFTNYF